MSAPPVSFTWQGHAFTPDHPRIADRHFVVGERYMLVEHHDRSAATHNHQFAEVAEAWRNLPEALADQFPSPDHLRKRALIDAGFYDETIIDAGSNAAALRVAAFLRGESDFDLVIVRGAFVIRRRAKSQSYRAMGREEFQRSKTAVLEAIAAMIGVEPAALQSAARSAA